MSHSLSTALRFRVSGILVICSMVFVGCKGEAFEQEETLPLDKVPPAVMKTAKEQLPEVTFQQAFKFEAEGKVVIEVRGTDPAGKLREVEVFESGELFKVE